MEYAGVSVVSRDSSAIIGIISSANDSHATITGFGIQWAGSNISGVDFRTITECSVSHAIIF